MKRQRRTKTGPLLINLSYLQTKGAGCQSKQFAKGVYLH